MNSDNNRLEAETPENGTSPSVVTEKDVLAVDAATDAVRKVASHHPPAIQMGIIRRIAYLLKEVGMQPPAQQSGAAE